MSEAGYGWSDAGVPGSFGVMNTALKRHVDALTPRRVLDISAGRVPYLWMRMVVLARPKRHD